MSYSSALICAFCHLILMFVSHFAAPASNDTRKIEEWWNLFSTSYTNYTTTTHILHEMQTAFPNIVRIYSIGKSVQSREMWVINLRLNVTKERKIMQPQMKIVANIHGDETLGRSLVLMLAVDIIRGYHENDTRTVDLLSATDIHLLPSINPDGFEETIKGEWNCTPNANKTGRLNANLVDLNTDFPHRFDRFAYSKDAGWTVQPETKNVMNWVKENYFVLSVNLFSESLVVSIPCDSVSPETYESPSYNDTGVYALTQENDVFLYLALTYSRNHRTMLRFTQSCEIDGNSTRNAITNGAFWRNCEGTMQDYNYYLWKCFEISVYLSCCKYPDPSTLLIEWDNNRESLYKLIEATHMGFRGVVNHIGAEDENSWLPAPFTIYHKKVGITVEKLNANGTPTSPFNGAIGVSDRGEYWKLALPGTYSVNLTSERLRSAKTCFSEFEGIVAVGNGSVRDPTVLDIHPPTGHSKCAVPMVFYALACALPVLICLAACCFALGPFILQDIKSCFADSVDS